jgi:hypothetical protein
MFFKPRNLIYQGRASFWGVASHVFVISLLKIAAAGKEQSVRSALLKYLHTIKIAYMANPFGMSQF